MLQWVQWITFQFINSRCHFPARICLSLLYTLLPEQDDDVLKFNKRKVWLMCFLTSAALSSSLMWWIFSSCVNSGTFLFKWLKKISFLCCSLFPIIMPALPETFVNWSVQSYSVCTPCVHFSKCQKKILYLFSEKLGGLLQGVEFHFNSIMCYKLDP